MEIKRERLGNGADGEFRARQLRARDMLRAAILSQPDEGWRSRYGGRGTEEVVADLEREDPNAVHAINVRGGA